MAIAIVQHGNRVPAGAHADTPSNVDRPPPYSWARNTSCSSALCTVTGRMATRWMASGVRLAVAVPVAEADAVALRVRVRDRVGVAVAEVEAVGVAEWVVVLLGERVVDRGQERWVSGPMPLTSNPTSQPTHGGGTYGLKEKRKEKPRPPPNHQV